MGGEKKNMQQKKTTRLSKVLGRECRGPAKSSRHAHHREKQHGEEFVDAADISLIERTAVEGRWQVSEPFSRGRRRGRGRIKNRLELKTQLSPPLRVKGSCGVSWALYLFWREAFETPLRILLRIQIAWKRTRGDSDARVKGVPSEIPGAKTHRVVSHEQRRRPQPQQSFSSARLKRAVRILKIICEPESKTKPAHHRASVARRFASHRRSALKNFAVESQGDALPCAGLFSSSWPAAFRETLRPADESVPWNFQQRRHFLHVYYLYMSPRRPHKFVNNDVYFMGFVQEEWII